MVWYVNDSLYYSDCHKGYYQPADRVQSHKALAEVALLSLNLVAKTRIQCSSLLDLSQTDSEGLPRLQQLLKNLPRGSLRYWEFP